MLRLNVFMKLFGRLIHLRQLPLGRQLDISAVSIKQDCNLLQGLALGLQEEAVRDDTLHNKYHDVDDVELPARFLESDRVDVLIHEDSCLGSEHVRGHALSADRVRQDLNRVSDREGGERDTVKELEKEDEDQDGDGGGVLAGLGEEGRADGPDREGDQHADCRDAEEGAAADTFCEKGGCESDAEVPDAQDAIDQSLRRLVGYSDAVEDSGEVWMAEVS